MAERFTMLAAQRRVWRSSLSSVETLVALALIDHWSLRQPQPFPSLPQLARWTKLDRATVQKAVKALRAKNVILGLEKPGRSTRYDLTPLMLLPVAENDGHPSRTATGNDDDTRRGERPHPSRTATTPVAENDPKEPKKGPRKEPREGALTEKPATSSRSRRKPNKPIPSDWTPLPRHQAKAIERGIELQIAAEKFRGHAESVDRRCSDWDRAFDNWLLNERVKSSPEPQRGTTPGWEPARF